MFRTILKKLKLTKLKRKRKSCEEIYKGKGFVFGKEEVYSTTDTGIIILDKCVEADHECRMESSPIVKAAEIQERINKIQRHQIENKLIPCYCNHSVKLEEITTDMCSICSYKDSCKTIRK